MGLRSRLENFESFEEDPSRPGLEAEKEEQRRILDQYKVQIHSELVEKLDLESLNKMAEKKARAAVVNFVDSLIEEKGIPLNRIERLHLVKEIEDETFGLGPIEPLLQDSTIDEILINGPDVIYVERFGRLERIEIQFRDEIHLRTIVDRIVSRIGRRVDEASPMVDGRLKDGSRINVIISPLALNGTTVSIRKFKKEPLVDRDMLSYGSASEEMLRFLEICVKGKMSVLVSGGTGTGKTTLLNILSGYIPHHERIITIEDAAELQLQQPHVVHLETRPANIEGRGSIVQRDLVKNSLRMRPDRIIVGEVRGPEALDMLQAMNTGHEGSMTTVHANTPRDALSRIETMVLMAGMDMPSKAINKQISSALDIIVQISRGSDGTRRVTSITEVTGMEGDIISTQEIYKFKQMGENEEGKVLGSFIATGVRPRCYEKLKTKKLIKGNLSWI